MLNSPTSGSNNYVYDRDNGWWKSLTQVHILDGMLVREMLKTCKGTLNL